MWSPQSTPRGSAPTSNDGQHNVPSGEPKSRCSASARNVITTFSFTTKSLNSARYWITLDLGRATVPVVTIRDDSTRHATPCRPFNRCKRLQTSVVVTRVHDNRRACELRLAFRSRARVLLGPSDNCHCIYTVGVQLRFPSFPYFLTHVHVFIASHGPCDMYTGAVLAVLLYSGIVL